MSALALIAAATTAAALAGCASTASGTDTTGKADVAGQPASRTVAPCAAADLAVTAGRVGIAMGHAGLALEFANTGSKACYVEGYPSVAAVLPHGELKAAQTPDGYLGGQLPGNRPQRVTLKPGAKAVAVLEWIGLADGGAGAPSPADCPGYGATALLVTTPGASSQANAIRLAGVDTSACAGFEIHPAIPPSESAVQITD
ncbi:MAG: DUF4232 domain-containing protein [Actinocrinis sp.]